MKMFFVLFIIIYWCLCEYVMVEECSSSENDESFYPFVVSWDSDACIRDVGNDVLWKIHSCYNVTHVEISQFSDSSCSSLESVEYAPFGVCSDGRRFECESSLPLYRPYSTLQTDDVCSGDDGYRMFYSDGVCFGEGDGGSGRILCKEDGLVYYDQFNSSDCQEDTLLFNMSGTPGSICFDSGSYGVYNLYCPTVFNSSISSIVKEFFTSSSCDDVAITTQLDTFSCVYDFTANGFARYGCLESSGGIFAEYFKDELCQEKVNEEVLEVNSCVAEMNMSFHCASSSIEPVGVVGAKFFHPSLSPSCGTDEELFEMFVTEDLCFRFPDDDDHEKEGEDSSYDYDDPSSSSSNCTNDDDCGDNMYCDESNFMCQYYNNDNNYDDGDQQGEFMKMSCFHTSSGESFAVMNWFRTDTCLGSVSDGSVQQMIFPVGVCSKMGDKEEYEEEIMSCTLDSDCEYGICVDHVCREGGSSCSSDSECGDHQYCNIDEGNICWPYDNEEESRDEDAFLVFSCEAPSVTPTSYSFASLVQYQDESCSSVQSSMTFDTEVCKKSFFGEGFMKLYCGDDGVMIRMFNDSSCSGFSNEGMVMPVDSCGHPGAGFMLSCHNSDPSSDMSTLSADLYWKESSEGVCTAGEEMVRMTFTPEVCVNAKTLFQIGGDHSSDEEGEYSDGETSSVSCSIDDDCSSYGGYCDNGFCHFESSDEEEGSFEMSERFRCWKGSSGMYFVIDVWMNPSCNDTSSLLNENDHRFSMSYKLSESGSSCAVVDFEKVMSRGGDEYAGNSTSTSDDDESHYESEESHEDDDEDLLWSESLFDFQCPADASVIDSYDYIEIQFYSGEEGTVASHLSYYDTNSCVWNSYSSSFMSCDCGSSEIMCRFFGAEDSSCLDGSYVSSMFFDIGEFSRDVGATLTCVNEIGGGGGGSEGSSRLVQVQLYKEGACVAASELINLWIEEDQCTELFGDEEEDPEATSLERMTFGCIYTADSSLVEVFIYSDAISSTEMCVSDPVDKMIFPTSQCIDLSSFDDSSSSGGRRQDGSVEDDGPRSIHAVCPADPPIDSPRPTISFSGVFFGEYDDGYCVNNPIRGQMFPPEKCVLVDSNPSSSDPEYMKAYCLGDDGSQVLSYVFADEECTILKNMEIVNTNECSEGKMVKCLEGSEDIGILSEDLIVLDRYGSNQCSDEEFEMSILLEPEACVEEGAGEYVQYFCVGDLLFVSSGFMDDTCSGDPTSSSQYETEQCLSVDGQYWKAKCAAGGSGGTIEDVGTVSSLNSSLFLMLLLVFSLFVFQ